MLIQMKVEGMLFDPRSNMYILLLKEIDGNGTLPIWIGKPEADSIALALGKVETPRPLTHDLIKNIADSLKVKDNEDYCYRNSGQYLLCTRLHERRKKRDHGGFQTK